jgi:hypothetical protein
MDELRVCPEGPQVVGWLQDEPLVRVDVGTVRLEARLPRETAHAKEVIEVLGGLAEAWGGPLRLEVVATSQGRPSLGFLVSLARGLTAAGSLRELVIYAGPVPVRHIALLVERTSAAFGPPVRVREGRP